MKQIRTVPEYRKFLEQKLNEYQISYSYLVSLMIVLERVVEAEAEKLGRRCRPFYNISSNNGDRRAWTCAAELAVWLRYKDYLAADYFEAICQMPHIQAILKHGTEQLSLNRIIPGFRKSGAKLRRYEDFYLAWRRKKRG